MKKPMQLNQYLPNKTFLKYLINRSWVTTGASILFWFVALGCGVLLAIKGSGDQSHNTLTNAIAMFASFGILMLILPMGERIRHFRSLPYNQNLPNFNAEIFKSIIFVFTSTCAIPLYLLYCIGSLSFLQTCFILAITSFLILASLFPSFLASILLFVIMFTTPVIISRTFKFENTQLLPIDGLSNDLSLLLLTIVFLVLSRLMLIDSYTIFLKREKLDNANKKYFTLNHNSRLTLFLNRIKLQFYYYLNSKLSVFRNKFNIFLWNYTFADIGAARGVCLGLCIGFFVIFPERAFSTFIHEFVSRPIESYSLNELSVFALMITILLIPFGMFNGNRFSSKQAAINYLWLREPVNSQKGFVNYYYKSIGLYILWELGLSYLIFSVCIFLSGVMINDFLLASLIFLVIKLTHFQLNRLLVKGKTKPFYLGLGSALTLVMMIVVYISILYRELDHLKFYFITFSILAGSSLAFGIYKYKSDCNTRSLIDM